MRARGKKCDWILRADLPNEFIQHALEQKQFSLFPHLTPIDQPALANLIDHYFSCIYFIHLSTIRFFSGSVHSLNTAKSAPRGRFNIRSRLISAEQNIVPN